MNNDKLLALVASVTLPDTAPPLEEIPRNDLVLTALVVCYKRGMSPKAAIDTLGRIGVTQNEARGAFQRLVKYYAERN